MREILAIETCSYTTGSQAWLPAREIGAARDSGRNETVCFYRDLTIHVPGTVLSGLHVLTSLILTTGLMK